MKLILSVFLVLLLFGCLTPPDDNSTNSDSQNPQTNPPQSQTNPSQSGNPTTTQPETSSTTNPSNKPTTLPDDWRNVELKDIKTGENFKINDYPNKPILLETFAVWCPKCTSQQNQIKLLHEELGNSFVSIAVNLDPSESETFVLKHINRFGFDWLYSINKENFGNQLINEFGIIVANPPTTPVILICPDQSFKLLRAGIKSANELKTNLESC